ncbi:hypothetical protein C0J26_11535 [Pseudomonas baetica]|uniref:hypothetical protein n=1 Tax=Pseudomonas baetica TaxID=674054 RepID=UPI000D1DBF12|nr:hypothetical protein [Pseudomonas baetica]PTC19063.1 hypothetical protein C0J26_11535 [Pseudomonas baetica]
MQEMPGSASSLASQLPQDFVVNAVIENNADTCGSEPAREGGVSVDARVAWTGLIAGKPAMAAANSTLMLIDTALSRAGSLPQGDCIATKEFVVIEK